MSQDLIAYHVNKYDKHNKLLNALYIMHSMVCCELCGIEINVEESEETDIVEFLIQLTLSDLKL